MEWVVDVAAWVIIGEAVWKLNAHDREQDRLEIESEAVRAEYRDTATSELRKRELMALYPRYLIDPPAWRYYEKPTNLVEQRRKDRRKRLNSSWSWAWIIAFVVIGYLIKWAFHQFFSPLR